MQMQTLASAQKDPMYYLYCHLIIGIALLLLMGAAITWLQFISALHNGDILLSESGYNELLTTYNHEYCLPVGCHDFVIDDSFGDGICCLEEDGYYRGSIYGWEEVFNGGNFNESAIENFCGEDLCPFATHYPSTSPSASSRPSATTSHPSISF